MPGGIQDPAVGYTLFCVVKFAGYSAAARFLAGRYERKDHSSLKVGAVRTLIGMCVGAAYYSVFMAVDPLAGDAQGLLFLLGLLPLRVVEWWFLIWLFFDRKLEHKRRGWALVMLGILWSYLLDIPATFGFLAVSFTVC